MCLVGVFLLYPKDFREFVDKERVRIRKYDDPFYFENLLILESYEETWESVFSESLNYKDFDKVPIDWEENYRYYVEMLA